MRRFLRKAIAFFILPLQTRACQPGRSTRHAAPGRAISGRSRVGHAPDRADGVTGRDFGVAHGSGSTYKIDMLQLQPKRRCTMRRFVVLGLVGLGVVPCASSLLLAQSFDFSPFLTLNDPTLHVSYAAMSNDCAPPPCTAAPFGVFGSLSYTSPGSPTNLTRELGTDSAGDDYAVSAVSGQPFGGY